MYKYILLVSLTMSNAYAWGPNVMTFDKLEQVDKERKAKEEAARKAKEKKQEEESQDSFLWWGAKSIGKFAGSITLGILVDMVKSKLNTTDVPDIEEETINLMGDSQWL